MRLLYIAPMPPPINGQSLASKVLYMHLSKDNEVILIDTNKKYSKGYILTFSRLFQIIYILFKIWYKRSYADVIYLQISESLLGNVKDIITYAICRSKINSLYIHLHGGSIKKQLFDKSSLLKKINKYFISRMGGIIVLGNSHIEIFSNLIDRKKIHIIHNFAEEFIFTNEERIEDKFMNLSTIKIVYMSNLIPGKGYLNLLSAFKLLSNKYKSKIQIDFCGGFNSLKEEIYFRSQIENFSQIQYHGIVTGSDKKKILNEAHVFCLPTSYLEGQPISILEAYASGCVVLSTTSGGIIDIFQDTINGYKLENNSNECIKNVIQSLFNKRSLKKIALNNLRYANDQYRTSIYCKKISDILR